MHIAGTKGKGSVALLLEQLIAPDRTTLSFSSPHLVSVKERVRLNGGLLADEIWNEGIAEIRRELLAEPAFALTYFETAWVFYLWAARKFQPDVHIVETGLGGSWDATNVLRNTLAVLTLVDYDHTDILGTTLTAIASDKSGIIKPRSTVMIGRQPEEAAAVYERVCRERGAHAHWLGRDFTARGLANGGFDYADQCGEIAGITLPCAAPHLRENAALALSVARELQPNLPANTVRDRLRQVSLPGRQQRIPGPPEIIVDVAHNPVSFAALAETLRRDFPGERVTAVIGMMKDKDAAAALAHLRGIVAELRTVDLGNPRSMPPEQLAAIARDCAIPAEAISRELAFGWLHETCSPGLGLVAGSFYLAGEYLKWRGLAGTA